MSGTQAVTVLVLFPVGSRYETKNISGISHFVEHMIFKGTEKRPTYLDISRELDAAGAEYNAFTYKDYTGYYVKIAAERADLAFDIISDMVFHSIFSVSEVEKEKGVIVEELRMYEDNPLMAVDLLSDAVALGDEPLGWDIGGSPETVKSLTREELFGYYKKYYGPNNAVLVVTGNFSASKLRKQIKPFVALKNLPEKNLAKQFLPFSGFVKKDLVNRVAVKERKIDQAQVILNFPGLKVNDKYSYALGVMLNLLGGTMSSRLFVEVREKRGLAYMVRASAASYRDVGLVQIQAGLDPARLEEAIKTILVETEKISQEEVSEKELKDAKSNLLGRLALAFEDSSLQAEKIAKQFWFLPKIESFTEISKKIKAVTAREIKAVAQIVFDKEFLTVAAIGPIKKEDIIKILK